MDLYGPVWTLYGPWKDLALKPNSIPWSVIAATLDKGILEKCFIISLQGPYTSLQIFFIPTRWYFNRNLLYGPVWTCMVHTGPYRSIQIGAKNGDISLRKQNLKKRPWDFQSNSSRCIDCQVFFFVYEKKLTETRISL